MTGAEYECRKCNRVFSLEEYEKDVFCPDCGMHLWLPRPPKSSGSRESGGKGRKKTDIEQIPPRPGVNIYTLFAEFNRLTDFTCGEGIVQENVLMWINARHKAYAEFREKLAQNRLISWEKLTRDFGDFLYFKNNLSWTTLYRTGLAALSNPELLWKFLTFVQDESIPIQTRVGEALEGEYHVRGIGKNILTALLHTFHPDKYGVWNNRTDDTLSLIDRKPKSAIDPGTKYVTINNELVRLCDELQTNLTTIDGLMWYVSKRLKPILLS
jgi:DNA-directed RNA polymerase subunit RPC12/RpoP